MLAIVMTIVGILIRLLPHPPNFTPVTATALFGGRYVSKKFAVLVPLVALVVSDYLLLYVNPFEKKVSFTKFYPLAAMFHSTTIFVWGSFMISSLIGIWLRNKKSIKFIAGGTILASLQFYLITNFGVWAAGYYEPGINGLFESYIMGLPFFRWTILGDIIYTAAFFAAFELALKLKKTPDFIGGFSTDTF